MKMILYPAIDLYEGKAVRLLKGNYNDMTVYSLDPPSIAEDFRNAGATHMHVVDLEGAKSGLTPNLETILAIKARGGLFVEVGGGIRTMEVIDKYLSSGIDRVILGTAAVTSPGFVREAVRAYGEKIAVGIDLKDGYVAIKGWTEKTDRTAFDFCAEMEEAGVKTLISTDISRDGAMKGTNHALYKDLTSRFSMDFIASGGVSTIEDVKKLKEGGLSGAIIGKAYYTGAIDLREALEVSK